MNEPYCGRPPHKHKNKNIKTLPPSYAYVALVSSGDMVGISISISVRLPANQRALYAYVNHVLTEHKHKHKKNA